MRVLLPDTWHFHRRNFAALFDALGQGGATIVVERSRRRWWKRHGDYRDDAPALAEHAAAIDAMPDQAWLTAEHLGINLFAIARAEFLCRVLPRPGWRDGAGSSEAGAILSRAVGAAEDRADLRLCLAAARDWISFWDRFFAADAGITHALAFSGSYIYTRALLAVARQRGIRTFVLESFFTGNEFYLEERATPLPNHSRLGDASWTTGLRLPSEPDLLDRLRAAAHARLSAMRNKNVRAGEAPLPRLFAQSPGTVLIVGQVLNDFSLIETPTDELSSLAIYRHLIARLMSETDLNVVFKAHPWERKRAHLRAPVTLAVLKDFVSALPEAQRARIALVETPSIRQLFHHADWVVGLCSQGLLEACQAGLKPAQIGNAFFGRQGFTHDFTDADAFVDALKTGALRGELPLEDYRRFEDFLVRALLVELVRNDATGSRRVMARLAEPSHRPTAPAAEELARCGPSLRLRDVALDVILHPVPWLRDALGWTRARLTAMTATRRSPP